MAIQTRREAQIQVAAAKKIQKAFRGGMVRRKAKRIQKAFRGAMARRKLPMPHHKRGKKSYEAGNILKEVSIGNTPWVGARIKMPYRKYRSVTSGPTGTSRYGPSTKRIPRTSTTRLVSRRCQSIKECKGMASNYGGKMTYIKYGKKKFYRNPAALAARKKYNKAEPLGGLGFIKSYRAAKKSAALDGGRRAAAANAASRKRKRNNINQSRIISGKRVRIATKR